MSKKMLKRGRKPGTIMQDPVEMSVIEPMHSEIQSVIFDPVVGWTSVKARRFLNRHNLKPMKRAHVTTTGRIHVRLQDPSLFTRLRTKQIAPGVEFIFGFTE